MTKSEFESIFSEVQKAAQQHMEKEGRDMMEELKRSNGEISIDVALSVLSVQSMVYTNNLVHGILEKIFVE